MVGWKKFRTDLGRSGAAAGVSLARRVHGWRRRRRHHRRNDAARQLRRLWRIRRRQRADRFRRVRSWQRRIARRIARRIVGLGRKLRRRRRRLQHRDERRRRRRRIRGGGDRRPLHAGRSTRERRCGSLQRSGTRNRAGDVGRSPSRERSGPKQRRATGQRSAKRPFGWKYGPVQRIGSGQGPHDHQVIPSERSIQRPTYVLARVPRAGTGQYIVALRIGSRHWCTV